MTTLLKCKMCGGTLEIQDNETVARCKYCGSLMTLPHVDTEKKARLFNRANEYRLNNEFDKAYDAYKAIVEEDPSEAEAYWGMILSEYGIEYVEDPKTGKRIPTCHRTQTKLVQNKAGKKRKRGIIVFITLAILACGIYTGVRFLYIPYKNYSDALALMNSGKYEEAISSFTALGEYRDSSNKKLECIYRLGDSYYSEGNYQEASDYFSKALVYSDAQDRYNDAVYQLAEGYFKDKKYKEASENFEKILD